MKNVLIVLLIILPLLLIGVTRTVSLDGTQQYTSIQTAINASVNGDIVLVYPGRYLENVIIQTNNISLISLEFYNHNPAYIDSTIIDGNNANACLRIFTDIQNVFVRGFSCTNASMGALGLFSGSSSSIVNCSVYGNKATGINASLCTVFLSGVRVHDNHTTGSGGG